MIEPRADITEFGGTKRHTTTQIHSPVFLSSAICLPDVPNERELNPWGEEVLARDLFACPCPCPSPWLYPLAVAENRDLEE